jgi:hypothetical protein
MTAMGRTGNGQAVRATIGFAVRGDGEGVAYARLADLQKGEGLVRERFWCRPQPALRGRNVAYGALAAVARALLARGLRCVRFEIEDADLVRDLVERRALPGALTVPYITLRCALNRFSEATVAVAGEGVVRDLTARARAESSLNVAA